MGAPGPRCSTIEAAQGPGPPARVRRRRATPGGCPCSAPTMGALRSGPFGMRPKSQLAGVRQAAGRPRRGRAVARVVGGSRLGSPPGSGRGSRQAPPRVGPSRAFLILGCLPPAPRGAVPGTLPALPPPLEGRARLSRGEPIPRRSPAWGVYLPPQAGEVIGRQGWAAPKSGTAGQAYMRAAAALAYPHGDNPQSLSASAYSTVTSGRSCCRSRCTRLRS